MNFLNCLFKVFAEFYRVACKNLKKDFFEALDHHNARLLELFRCRKRAVGESLHRILESINTQVSVIYDHRYHLTVVLQASSRLTGAATAQVILKILILEHDHTYILIFSSC